MDGKLRNMMVQAGLPPDVSALPSEESNPGQAAQMPEMPADTDLEAHYRWMQTNTAFSEYLGIGDATQVIRDIYYYFLLFEMYD